MSKTLEEIRKKLQTMGRRPAAGSGFSDKTTYAHWNIPEGTSATVRFLPDANPENVFFWAERQMFKLPFRGIKGHDENKQVFVQTPCIEMWTGKNTCPILNEVRPWWQDESLKQTASTYWIKRTYYMQGFVKADPLGETDPPDNPIRKFIISPQIFAIVKAALLDPDMEESPVDYINGTDFIISKTSKGGFADYSTSKWARKESSITEEMQNAINTHGLVDLSTYLPKRPTDEQVAAMFEMFQASLDGELYDPARWSEFYKPYGMDGSTGDDTHQETPKKVSVPVKSTPAVSRPAMQAVHEQEDTEPAVVSETPKPQPVASEGKKSPQEIQNILEMLRNRNK